MDSINKMKWVFILVMFTITLTNCQKVQMTRTALHVARSLDPNSMEEMSVKTKNGDTATILVKKRNGRHENITQVETSTSASLNETSFVPVELIYKNPTTNTSSLNIERSENESSNEPPKRVNQTRVDRSDNRVPNPVQISSSPVFVKGQQDIGNMNKRGRSIIKLDQDGIPIVTGIRVHDDESDRVVWRNARVINGTLVPYDKSNNNFVTKLKPIRKPISNKEEEEGWTKISSVTKKPPNTLQIINTANLNEYAHKNWNIKNKPTVLKPANGVEFTPIWTANNKASSTRAPETVTSFTEKWDMVNKPTLKPYGSTTAGSAILHTIESEDDKPLNYMQHPLGIWVEAAGDKTKNPEEHYVTDKILEYIRNINKEEVKRLSLQPFTSRDARTISRYRTPRHQPAIQSRILQNAGNTVFLDSPIYSPSTSTPSRVSFEEGVRTPVLQYAHPEYGVQSTKALSQPDSIDALDSSDRRDPSLSYFGHDVHADRSPFAFEPGLADQVRVELPGKKSHTPTEKFHPRPKKTLPYFYNDVGTSSPSSYTKYVGRYPPDNNFKGSEFPGLYYEDNRPFWMKFGDQIKEQVQTSFEKVSDYTKPIMEPIMEATSKISQNLGFSKGNRDISAIRERLGLAAPSSLILPAIGIVAGGAALGLGAVAVGRYLNYEVVRMRSGKSLEDQSENIPIFNGTFEQSWAEDKSRSGSDSQIVEADEKTKTRRRRNIFDVQTERYEDDKAQNLGNIQNSKKNMYPEDLWSNTPCSKKVFCEVLVQKSPDSIPIMEKRIVTFLSMIDQKLAIMVAPHLDEVMSAIRRSDCSSFKCNMKFTNMFNQT